MYPGAWLVIVEGVWVSTSSTPRSRSAGNSPETFCHSRPVRSVGAARKDASPAYGVTLARMKAATSIRCCQSVPEKPCQPLSAPEPVMGVVMVSVMT